MCDLKRTLDATVSVLINSVSGWLTRAIPGPLCTRNAFRNWQNCVAAIFDCLVSAGAYSPDLTRSHHFYPLLRQVLPYSPKTDLLFAYGTRNRESPGRVEKIDGIPH